MYFPTRLGRWISCFLPLSLTACLSSSSLSVKACGKDNAGVGLESAPSRRAGFSSLHVKLAELAISGLIFLPTEKKKKHLLPFIVLQFENK